MQCDKKKNTLQVKQTVHKVVFKNLIKLKKNALFFEKNALFSKMCAFFSNTFGTKNYHRGVSSNTNVFMHLFEYNDNTDVLVGYLAVIKIVFINWYGFIFTKLHKQYPVLLSQRGNVHFLSSRLVLPFQCVHLLTMLTTTSCKQTTHGRNIYSN